MPLLKAQKLELAKKYHEQATGALNVVVIKQQGIPVNKINDMRTDLAEAEGKLEIIKKRVFLKSIESDFPGLTIDEMEGSVAVLYSYNESDIHAPLKVVQKHNKLWKKEKAEFGMDYVGGRYDKVWQDGAHVSELANLPSKEELIGKLLFMLNHPMSSLARACQAIADQSGEGETEAVEETPVEEVKEELKEETVAETKEETPAEETVETTDEVPAEEKVAEESEKSETPEADDSEAETPAEETE